MLKREIEQQIKQIDKELKTGIKNSIRDTSRVAGEGHFIHTYMGDGNPLPSFEGEPTWVDIDGDIDEFTDMVWENLNEDNKVSLFVRYIDIATGEYESRIVNKNK